MQRAAAGLGSVHFHLMPVMRLQHGAVPIQGDILPVLGDDPIAAGLLQAAPHNSFLATGRTGCGARVALTTRGSWLLLAGCTRLGLCALRVLICTCTSRTASTGLCQGHATDQHKCHQKFSVHVFSFER